MTARKFFFVLRRVNAIILLLAGTLGCAALAVVLYMIIKEATRQRNVRDVLNVTGPRVTEAKTSLDEFDDVDGSVVLRAALHVEQDYSMGSFSKEARSTQNFLFFDPTNDRSYWLIPDFQGIITTTVSLREAPDSTQPVKAFAYELIEQDSNHDGRLTCADLKDIAISDPAGTHFTRVLTGVERSYGVHLLPGGNEAVVVYTPNGGSPQIGHVEITTGKVLKRADLLPPKSLTASASAPSRCGDGAY